jgi:hypothetical protein
VEKVKNIIACGAGHGEKDKNVIGDIFWRIITNWNRHCKVTVKS